MKENIYLPDVSILIPVKNMEKYIKKCIDSLLAQEYPKDKIEILILDNHSTDRTIEIVKDYSDKRIKIIQSGVDSPPVKYNKIIPELKSEIVAFADGDAYFENRWLLEILQPLKEEKIAGSMGKVLTANPEKLLPLLIGYEFEHRFNKLSYFVTRTQTMHSAYKRKVLLEVGLFDEELKTGYDCEIGWRINAAGYKIVYISYAIAYHNHRENLYSYFKQQLEYSIYATYRNLKNKKIAKGDKFASFWITSQPAFYYLSMLTFLILRNYLSLIPICLLFLGYLFSSIKIAKEFKDLKCILLTFVFFVRSIAWSIGIPYALIRKILK